ncbi:MAG: hypothetical protein QX199_19975 [Methylococcaceae bacterium]
MPDSSRRLNLRGAAVPVIDLSARAISIGRRNCIIIIEAALGELNSCFFELSRE